MINPITAAQMRADYAVMATPIASRIIAIHAFENGVTLAELRSPDRKRPIVHIRQDLMLRLRNETSHSLPEIGRMISRDHTTVLLGIRQAEKRAAQ